MATDTMRPAGLLPMIIKCSTCHVEIDIAAMGDHVCEAPSAAVAPPPPFAGRTNTMRSSSSRGAEETGSSPSKQAKAPAPLAPIDPRAANRGAAPRGHAPEAEGIRDTAARSARWAPRSRSPVMTSAQASPVPWRRAPPSPQKSNLDCAFPPFPIGHHAASRPPGSPREPPRKPSLVAAEAEAEAEADPPLVSPVYGPLSPRTYGGDNVVQRMNTIAPGPFEVRPQPRAAGEPHTSSSAPDRAGRFGSISSVARPSVEEDRFRGRAPDTGWVSDRSKSPFRANAPLRDGSSGLGPAAPHNEADPTRMREDPHRQGSVSSARYRQVSPLRSNTFPVNQEPTLPLQRRPTEPFLDPHPLIQRSEKLRWGSQVDKNGRAARPPFLPATDSREQRDDRPAESRQIAGASRRRDPSVLGNPYHTPTESVSSNGSGYGSDTRTASSRSTPPMSGSPERFPPKKSAVGPVVSAGSRDGVHSSSNDTRAALASHGSHNRRGHLVLQPTPAAESHRADHLGQPPESPLDPAIQGGRYSREPFRPARTAQADPSTRTPEPPRAPASGGKGNCRGCGENIIGKSVSSADGQLTGRYHKQCFVCWTCQAPFDTKTFYVLNNHPYCERHYHQLNHSLCEACDCGIEGQYLETERRQKFHPDCLSCRECGMILREDYFEMNNRVYCERHAFQLSQQATLLGPGRRHPERRTTRLMVM